MTDRALFILPDPGNLVAERQVAQRAARLRQAGCTVSVCSLGSRASGGPLDGVHIPQRPGLDPLAIWNLRKHLRSFRPRVVYVAAGEADLCTALAAWQMDVRVVLEHPTSLPHWWRRRGASAIELTVSTAAEHAAALRQGDQPHRVHQVVPLIDWLPASLTSRGELTRSLGIPENARWLGVVAELVSEQRLRDAVWVADLLKVVRDDTHMLIFGEGPERLRLEKFRRRVEIEDRVHFLGQPAQLAAWLSHLDCYWCAAGNDAIDAIMIHMMRVGVPLVLADTPGHRELVQHEHNGLLFPVGNRAHFARQTLRILEQPELREQLVRQARASWTQRFADQQRGDRWLDLHRQLCQSSRSRMNQPIHEPHSRPPGRTRGRLTRHQSDHPA